MNNGLTSSLVPNSKTSEDCYCDTLGIPNVINCSRFYMSFGFGVPCMNCSLVTMPNAPIIQFFEIFMASRVLYLRIQAASDIFIINLCFTLTIAIIYKTIESCYYIYKILFTILSWLSKEF